MTKLLVSVRDVAEAEIAFSAGADLIDIKEPRHGSLGAADAQTTQAICARFSGRALLSAALGELLAERSGNSAVPVDGLRFAKLGLAGCGKLSDWPERWRVGLAGWPSSIRPVAVIYADAHAESPSEQEVVAVGQRLGCAAALVDTFDKSQGGLFAHWSLERVAAFIEQCRAHGLISVVAGSLSLETIRDVLPLRPDYVAVRGAACEGPRTSTVSAARIAELVELVRRRERQAINTEGAVVKLGRGGSGLARPSMNC